MNAYRKSVQVNDLSESRRILQSREFSVPDFAAGLRAVQDATDLVLPNIIGMAERVLFLVNGPEHLARRKAWMAFFRTDNIRRWDDEIRAIAETAVAQLPETGEIELVSAFSIPIVSTANCRLLGVPEKNHRLYNEWTTEISSLVESVLSIRRARRAEELAAQFATDLRSCLSSQAVPVTPAPSMFDFLGESLPDDTPEAERIWTLMALYMTGLATLFTFSNVLSQVATSPEEYRRKLIDPETSHATFDDLIGRSGAVIHMHRIARQTTQVAGVSLAPGDTVIARTVDPNAVPSTGGCPFSGSALAAPRLDSPTEPTQMPFGVGLHKCIGEDFARRVIRHGVTALLRRFPDFRTIRTPIHAGPVPNISGPDALHCQLGR
jgi:cytochrome P450